MKLGKKLEVTDKKERMKLLIDGEVFYTDNKEMVYFDIDSCDGNPFRCRYKKSNVRISKAWYMDWYYPAKTYTINGVELEDNRLSYEDFVIPYSAYACDFTKDSLFSIIGIVNQNSLKQLCDHSLVHSTAESAIAHTKAMLRVEE